MADVKDLHKPGVLCVHCSAKEPKDILDRVFHPADRPCIARGDASEKGCENYPPTGPGSVIEV